MHGDPAARQMIVFFVGPDMTGKTNIAQALARELNIPYFKASSEHGTFLNAHDSFLKQLLYADPRLQDFLKQTQHSVIFDRGYPCEWAYAHTLDRKTDDAAINFIDEQYAKMGAKIIMCSRSSYKGIYDDLDPTINEDVLTKLDRKYRDFLAFHTMCENMILNVDDENLEREVQEAIEFIAIGKK